MEILAAGLNLSSPRAFHWMKMPEVADTETLPVLQARAGEPAAWDALDRRTNDGSFLLYSIGWNETDDDGLPGVLAKPKNGDWVWSN